MQESQNITRFNDCHPPANTQNLGCTKYKQQKKKIKKILTLLTSYCIFPSSVREGSTVSNFASQVGMPHRPHAHFFSLQDNFPNAQQTLGLRTIGVQSSTLRFEVNDSGYGYFFCSGTHFVSGVLLRAFTHRATMNSKSDKRLRYTTGCSPIVSSPLR